MQIPTDIKSNVDMIEMFEEIHFLSVLLNDRISSYHSEDSNNYKSFVYIVTNNLEIVYEYSKRENNYNVYVEDLNNMSFDDFYLLDENFNNFEEGFLKWVELVKKYQKE